MPFRPSSRRQREADRQAQLDRDVWGDAVAEAVARREAEARAARPKLGRRITRAVWQLRAQVVPVVVIAALLVAGLVIRAEHVSPFLVAPLGVAALAGYGWWRALGADRPALVMLRPALAVAYLVASALVA